MRSEEKQEITGNPNDNNVISVRGNKAKRFPGNERYADMIREHVGDYRKCKTNSEKNAIAKEIMEQVRGCGGNFLKQHDPKKPIYIIMEEQSIIEKIKQALRDAKRNDEEESNLSVSKNSTSKLKRQQTRRVNINGGSTLVDDIEAVRYDIPSTNGHAGSLIQPHQFRPFADLPSQHYAPSNHTIHPPSNSATSNAVSDIRYQSLAKQDSDEQDKVHQSNGNGIPTNESLSSQKGGNNAEEQVNTASTPFASLPQHPSVMNSTDNHDLFSQSMSSIDSWGQGQVPPLSNTYGYDMPFVANRAQLSVQHFASSSHSSCVHMPSATYQQYPATLRHSMDLMNNSNNAMPIHSQYQTKIVQIRQNMNPTTLLNSQRRKAGKRHSTGSISSLSVTESSSLGSVKRISLLSDQSKPCRQLEKDKDVLTGPEIVRSMSIVSGTSLHQYLNSPSFRRSSLLGSTTVDSMDDVHIRDSLEVSRSSSRFDYLSEDVSMKCSLYSDDSTFGLVSSSFRRNAICMDERHANKLKDVLEIPEEAHDTETGQGLDLLVNSDVLIDHKPSRRVSTLATPSTSRNNSQAGFNLSQKKILEYALMRKRLSQTSIPRSSIYSKLTDESSMGYMIDDSKGVDEMLYDITKRAQDMDES